MIGVYQIAPRGVNLPRNLPRKLLRERLLGNLRMAKLPKTDDKDVLRRAACVKEAGAPPLPPFLKPKIIELPHVVGDDERRDVVLEAFLEEDQAPDAAVAVLKRMDLLEAHMQIKQVRQRLVGALPPREQFRHLAGYVFGGTRLHFPDHVVEPLVFANCEPVLAAVARPALQDFMKPLYVCFRQSGRGGRDYPVDRAEVVCRLDNIVDGHVRADFPNRLRLEYPPCLLVREAASLDVVRVVGDVDLKAMVQSSGDA